MHDFPVCYKNSFILFGLNHFQRCDFYRAMLCIRGTSHGPVSVCVCVRLSQVGVLLKRLIVGSHNVTCHPTKVTFPPAVTPAEAGTRLSDPGGMQG